MSCLVQLEKWIMPVDLLVLRQLQNFDILLGMDWLARYYAIIDCRDRIVIFCELGQEEYVYRSCQSTLFAMMISTSKAK